MDKLILISLILLWIIVFFNLLITFRLIRIISPDVWEKSIPTLNKGQIAPQFKIETIEGEFITPSAFISSPLLLIFFSFECSNCFNNIPNFQSISGLSIQNGIQLVFICDSDRGKTIAIKKEFNLSIPIYMANKENSIWKRYKVSGVPYFCLIDEHLRIQATGLLDPYLENIEKLWKINSKYDLLEE